MASSAFVNRCRHPGGIPTKQEPAADAWHFQTNQAYAVAVLAFGFQRPLTIGTRSADCALTGGGRLENSWQRCSLSATPCFATSGARKANSIANVNGGLKITQSTVWGGLTSGPMPANEPTN